MDSKKNSGNYMQCQYCGNIYYLDQEVSVDKLIIDSECPKCGYTRALNCGDRKEDIYLYMNESIDPRYYLY